MASYSSSNYSNDYYDLSGIYFNPISSSSSSIDITTLDERYLKLSGGTISNNLIISNSLDVQTSLTLPTIGNVETEIQAKQDILSSSSDITTGTISSGNITIRSGSILTSPNYTISGTPTETTHAISKGYVDDVLTIQTGLIVNLETNKQDVLNDGDLTIAKTSGLQTALDGKQDDITSTTRLTLNGVTAGFVVVGDAIDVEEKFDAIDITTTSNTSTISSIQTQVNALINFTGFRAEMSQESDLSSNVNNVLPFNSISGNSVGFVYDTNSGYDTSTYFYTIPIGYGGYWNFNMKLFIAEYSEEFRRIHLRVSRGATNYEPLQIGNYYSQVDILNGTIPVLEGDVIKIVVSNGGIVKYYDSRDNCWFEGRYLGI